MGKKSTKKLTLEEFITKSVLKHTSKEYDYSKVKYVNSVTKVEIICPTHGPFWQTPNSHLSGSGCKKCAGTTQITNDGVDARLAGRKILRVGQVTNTATKIKWQCLVANCGHEWETTPASVLQGKGCRKCAGQEPLNNATVDARLAGRKILRLDQVTGSETKIKWRCLEVNCGHEWKTTPSSILKGTGCRKCAGVMPLTNDEIDKRLQGRNIQRIGNISGVMNKILWKCLLDGCSHEWIATPSNIMQGKGCRKCAKYGFDPSKPSVVYVYNIADTWVGYGITNDFKTRSSTHRRSFKNNNIMSGLVATYKCIGYQALEIENNIKKLFPLTGCKLEGFKTESTTINNLAKVLTFISYQLH